MSSPAKINLGLKVIGKRPDGYHELETIFQEISLADSIEFYPSNEWSLTVHGADLDSGPSNLITKAATLLSKFTGCPQYARVIVHKKIPMGGGLGGGSSNGSIALLGLNRLWKLELSEADLLALSAELGSDCPFFIYGGLVKASGRGERLELLNKREEAWVVLVCPNFSISTAWAFKSANFPLTNPLNNVIFNPCTKISSVETQYIFGAVNHLENIVFQNYPQLECLQQMLRSLGAYVSLLSGSGSSMFGLFKNLNQARHAALQLGKNYSTHICETIGRSRSAR